MFNLISLRKMDAELEDSLAAFISVKEAQLQLGSV
jgi:hypothetical protein